MKVLLCRLSECVLFAYLCQMCSESESDQLKIADNQRSIWILPRLIYVDVLGFGRGALIMSCDKPFVSNAFPPE